MPEKIVVATRSFGRFSRKPLEELKRKGYAVEFLPIPVDESALGEAIQDAEALIIGNYTIPESVLMRARRLKIIVKHGVGVNNIPTRVARRLGIMVAFTPGANTESVADLTFGLILSIARAIPFSCEAVRKGEWLSFVGRQIYAKTLGIIGLGRIGKAVARRALGFSMRILSYDPIAELVEGVELVELEELLSSSDIVTLHLPLTERTKKLISERELRLMKREGYLVNTSRGGVLDEEALFRALTERWIAGAALDVLLSEPPDPKSPLLRCPNLIITSHIGASTFEALERMGMMAAKAVIDALDGRRPENLVEET